jgi:hypothetical protein
MSVITLDVVINMNIFAPGIVTGWPRRPATGAGRLGELRHRSILAMAVE